MVERVLILAQREGLDLQKLIYLLIFVLFPLLGGLGKWLRDRSANKSEEVDAESSEQTPERLRARPAPKRYVAPPAMPAPRRPAPVAPPETEPGPEVIIAQVLESAFPSQRPPPPRRQERPVRPPRHAAPHRPKRARRVSREEEVRALKDMMEKRGDAVPVPRHPAALGDWTSLSIAELRRAIVLKEVLGPPVALRGELHQF